MKQAYGNWVSGDRFWDRKQDLELFIERIEDGQHILLVAQRRMGKTSLMRQAIGMIKNRYICLFVDFQKSKSAEDAVVELSLSTHPHKSLWSKTTDLFSNILGRLRDAVEGVEFGDVGIKLRAGLSSGNWSEKGNQLFSLLAASEKPVLLLFDEVPILVNRILKGEDEKITPGGIKQADEFMSWIRYNSIQHQGKVSMVLSGSIGLEPVLNQAGLSATLNTFSPFELKPWDEETAAGCLNALASEYGVEFRDNAQIEMVRRLGCCIPHHVQMFFTNVHDRCRRRGRMEFFPDEVEDVYHSEMLSIRGHAELTHYEERLKLVLGMEYYPLALEMLTEAAVTGGLEHEALVAYQKAYVFENKSAMEMQRQILQILEHDGYLEQLDKRYTFLSKLLRDWWKMRYEAFFVPVLERSV